MSSTLEVVTFTSATPDGAFTVVAGPRGVLASGWAPDASTLLPLVHKSLRPDGVTALQATDLRALNLEIATRDGSFAGAGSPAAARSAAPFTAPLQTPVDPRIVAATANAALVAFYDGDLAAPARVPVLQASGPFREHAWDVLRGVQPGEAITYTEYAERAGRPAAVRAAASACAMNAAALFVPCHRVLRSDGSLGGFRYGLPIKQQLLAREAARA